MVFPSRGLESAWGIFSEEVLNSEEKYPSGRAKALSQKRAKSTLSLKVRRRSPIYRLGGEGVHGLSPTRARRRWPDDPDEGPDDPGWSG